jgi:hypothetical protein
MEMTPVPGVPGLGQQTLHGPHAADDHARTGRSAGMYRAVIYRAIIQEIVEEVIGMR